MEDSSSETPKIVPSEEQKSASVLTARIVNPQAGGVFLGRGPRALRGLVWRNAGAGWGGFRRGFRIDLRSQDRDKKTETGDQSKITNLTRQPKGGGL